MTATLEDVETGLPPGCVWDELGYPQYWSAEYECWMHPVVWDPDTGQVVYALQPKQWELLLMTPVMRPHGAPGPTFIGFGGAAGGGKSYVSRVVATVVAQSWPGSKTIIFRETEDAVKENHLDKIMLELPARWYDPNLADLRITWRGTRSSTRFGYLKDKKSLKKYLGQDYDCMIFEEATQYDPDLIDWLVGNRLRASVPGATPFALLPSNPGGAGHYEYKRRLIDRRFRPDREEDPADYAFLQAKLEDNQILVKRDPKYIKKLRGLAEPYRSWFMDGDFAAGGSISLPQLDRHRHYLANRPFIPPRHWPCFGSFDWGYQHPFSFGYWCANEDGRVFLCTTVRGRHLNDAGIADRIIETLRARGLDPGRLTYIAAGHDCWHEIKAREEHGETTAERFTRAGLALVKANISRISGLKQVREYIAWELGVDDPAFVLMNTPENEATFECMESRVPDPDNIEDVLKTDANEFGEGGDDDFEMVRYGLMSRPARARTLITDEDVDAFGEATLAYEAEVSRRVRTHARRYEDDDAAMVHPEFGTV